MKRWNEGFNPRKTAFTTFGLFGAVALASAQTISNPSFELNSFTNGSGYISGNTNIVGWTKTGTNHAGLNPVSGGTPNPFADNGADFTALASMNLSLPLANWTVLGNIPAILSGQYQFTVSTATNFPQRFYRVVSP